MSIQYSCLENPMDGGAWYASVHGVTKSQTWLSDLTFTFYFHALEKEMATHSSVLAWRIPEKVEPGGLLSMWSHSRTWLTWFSSSSSSRKQKKTNIQNATFICCLMLFFCFFFFSLTLCKTDAGRDWGQEEKGTTEDEMAGWHHWLDGRESEWTPGVGDGQGGLVCCSSWGRKESDTTERLNWTEN